MSFKSENNEEVNRKVVVIPYAESNLLLGKHRAFYAEGGKYLYCLKENDDLQIPGLTNVYVKEYFDALLKGEVSGQLNLYLSSNMDSMEMYRYDDFWEGALRYAGRPIPTGTIHASTQQVGQGIVTLHCHIPESVYDPTLTCCYDFVSERLFLQYSDKAGEEAPQDFLLFYYHGRERYILAEHQFDAGRIPSPYKDAYCELCRINRFLAGKRTARNHFNSGKVTSCYPRTNLTAADLIEIKDTDFTPKTYNFRCGKKDIPVRLRADDGLPCKLTHYSQTLEIEAAALTGLNLTSTDPEVLARRAQEADRDETARLISEGGCFTFCQVRLWFGNNLAGVQFLPGRASTLDDLLQQETIRSALLPGLIKHCEDCRAEVTSYCVGSGTPAPIPNTLLEAVKAIPPSGWPRLPGYSKQAKDPVCIGFDALFDTFIGSQNLSHYDRMQLLIARLRRSVPEETSYRFSNVEIFGEAECKHALVSGHPQGDKEVLHLVPVQKFILDYPGDSFTVYIHRYYLGAGKSENLPDHLLKLAQEIELGDAFDQAIFDQFIVHVDEYNFIQSQEEQAVEFLESLREQELKLS